MRMVLFAIFLIGCGTPTSTPPVAEATKQADSSSHNTFVGRAKAYVAQARRSVDVLKTEGDPEKLLALKTEVTKSHSELQQPAAESEQQKDLQRYLENIHVNFATAVDFQIEHLAAEKTSDEEKKKSTKEDAEMMINGTPKICDQADEILKTM